MNFSKNKNSEALKTIEENSELYEYLNKKYGSYSKNFFGMQSKIKTLKTEDLYKINNLFVLGVQNFSGIERLPNLKKLEIYADKGAKSESLVCAYENPNLQERLLFLESPRPLQGEFLEKLNKDVKLCDGNTRAYITREDVKALNKRLDEIKAKIPKNIGEIGKAKNIYKQLTNIEWDDEALSSKSFKVRNKNAYGGIVYGKAVCEGFADSLRVAACDNDIEVNGVGGRSNLPQHRSDPREQNHGWTQMKLNGQWYNFDLSWDAGEPEEKWENFMCSDEKFSMGHIPSKDYLVHPCTDKRYDNVKSIRASQKSYSEVPKNFQINKDFNPKNITGMAI